MSILLLGLVIFFAAHSVSLINEAWRDHWVAKIGELPWKGLYSLVSVVGFLLIVWGYGVARHDPVIIYLPPVWLRHLAILLLVPVFPLLLAAYHPGRIQTATKHPMLLATILWSFAHLLVNGMLADMLLFGAFLTWAIVVYFSMQHRTQRPLPGAPPAKANDIIAVIGGLALYVTFVLWIHTWLIGVSPIGS